MLGRVDGPECPTCGCRDSAELAAAVSLWGNPSSRRRCRHCATEWSADPDDSPAYSFEFPTCRRCGSRMLVTRTADRVRYLKCSRGNCGETGKAVRHD